MKNTAAAFAALLTFVSLIASPSPSIASPAGLGGGSNVGHNTPSHPSAFGRGFATGLLASGPIVGDGALTTADRWGPDHTVAFGRPTRGWGLYEVHKQPGTYEQIGGFQQPISCPCVVAYDPFNRRINGGVDIPEARTLAEGVRDYTEINERSFAGGSTHAVVEGQLMSAVWGNNFNPNQQQASAHAATSTPASLAGLGGGVSRHTPANPPAFGRGFALALSATPPTYIANDRWPQGTVAFGNPTTGWGPFEVNKQPGTFDFQGPQQIACPCVVAYDPFKKNLNGGVPVGAGKALVFGVPERIEFDEGTGIGPTSRSNFDAAVMGAVWGPNFDPSPPPGSNQQQVASGHRKGLPED
jgi:hypothetical protein